MEIMKLVPTGKDYLWGGTRLREEYGKKIDLTPLAETWECSVHPDGPSYIANGEFKGLALVDVLKQHPEYIGTKVEDTDYCCRIRRAGLNILFCEKAVIYHKVSASTGKNSDSMTYYTTRNKLYIARDFTTNRYSAYARITLQLLKDVIRGRKRLSPIVGGYRSFFKNEVGRMPKN